MARNGNFAAIEPLRKITAITKSDSTVYSPPLDAIYIGGAGNVAIVDGSGATVTITAPVVGQWMYVEASKIMSTNTTATAILGGNW
jgi:hypothetical protein